MTHTDSTPSPAPAQRASKEMAARLAVNRTGQLTTAQRRTVLTGGVVALAFLLCPLAMILQMGAVVLADGLPIVTAASVFFFVLGVLMFAVFLGLAGTNVHLFLRDVFGREKVRVARGLLQVHMSSKERPELPFSYIVEDYSFAPYVPPPDVDLRLGAPYLVYYAAHSRIFLSMAALDATDAKKWTPTFSTDG